MKVTKVKIKKVMPDKGLVGFASCVIDDSLYLGNIAIFTRLGEEDKIRLVFPVKEVSGKKIEAFYPLTSDLYYLLEQEIAREYKQND
jgi:DNA-binding cell septation regulator SpoVG